MPEWRGPDRRHWPGPCGWSVSTPSSGSASSSKPWPPLMTCAPAARNSSLGRMSRRQWEAVDDYFTSALIDTDPETDDALHAALAASDAAGLPAIAVSPTQGKLLNMLATLINARRILEIGTLAGYSTIWLARALPPDGRLISLES